MQESWVQSLGWEDPLEKEMATHSRIPAWRIPWIVEPGWLQSMGSKRVGHDWVTDTLTWCKDFTFVQQIFPRQDWVNQITYNNRLLAKNLVGLFIMERLFWKVSNWYLIYLMCKSDLVLIVFSESWIWLPLFVLIPKKKKKLLFLKDKTITNLQRKVQSNPWLTIFSFSFLALSLRQIFSHVILGQWYIYRFAQDSVGLHLMHWHNCNSLSKCPELHDKLYGYPMYYSF